MDEQHKKKVRSVVQIIEKKSFYKLSILNPKVAETPHRGGSNVVGIICPLVGIGLTDLPKTGGAIASPSPLLLDLCIEQFGKI